MPFALVSPGARRMVTLARATGTRVLDAPATFGASMPVTVIAGRVHRRSTTGPAPIDWVPGAAPDSARHRSSGYSTSAAAADTRPATAGLPSSVHSVDSSLVRVMMASGTRPPHMPEWTAWVSVRTSTST